METLSPVLTSLDDKTSLPAGFSYSGIHAGIKRSRADLGLIVCRPGTTAAACFTLNAVKAACVVRNASLLPGADVRAVIVNSGNANALTGAAGDAANLAMAQTIADAMQIPNASVLTASTGVIGIVLDPTPIIQSTAQLLGAAESSPLAFARAILTTDTVIKVAILSVEIPERAEPVRIMGVAKGSGMIHPNMATTLGFVCTDAALSPALLQKILSSHIDSTFNAITVDGDTSTNDTVVVLASGAQGAALETPAELEAFSVGLKAVLHSLAQQVARDGEGATRLLEVAVTGAADDTQAMAMARAICRGSLFKCSVFAGEAGYGRLAAAAGQAAAEHGFPLALDRLCITAQGIALVQRGLAVAKVDTTTLSRRLRDANVRWTLEVGDGPGSFVAFGCDLSYDYVRINADEAMQVEVGPGGSIGRNLSLSAYSPQLKHQLLVDGLEYVRRFSGLRILVHLSGASARRPTLLACVAEDVALLLDAGLRPVVVVDDSATATAVQQSLSTAGYHVTLAGPDAATIAGLLDRGRACLLIQKPDPQVLVALAIAAGVSKLVSLGDDQGLHDDGGLVHQLSPESVLAGLERGRFRTEAAEALALARHAALQGLPALHLIDGRMPHALVAELFTDEGVGTLVTRQSAAHG